MSEIPGTPADRLLRVFERPARVIVVVLRILLAAGTAIALVLKVYMIVLTDHVCAADATSLGNTIRCTPALALLGYGLAFAATLDFCYRLLTETPRRFLSPFIQGLLAFLILFLAGTGAETASWDRGIFVLPVVLLLVAVLWLQGRDRP